jgi:hypothetical protein
VDVRGQHADDGDSRAGGSVNAKVVVVVERANGRIAQRGELDGFAGEMTRLRGADDAMQADRAGGGTFECAGRCDAERRPAELLSRADRWRACAFPRRAEAGAGGRGRAGQGVRAAAERYIAAHWRIDVGSGRH